MGTVLGRQRREQFPGTESCAPVAKGTWVLLPSLPAWQDRWYPRVYIGQQTLISVDNCQPPSHLTVRYLCCATSRRQINNLQAEVSGLLYSELPHDVTLTTAQTLHSHTHSSELSKFFSQWWYNFQLHHVDSAKRVQFFFSTYTFVSQLILHSGTVQETNSVLRIDKNFCFVCIIFKFDIFKKRAKKKPHGQILTFCWPCISV